MKLIECKEVNGNVMHDAHIFVTVELDDGSVQKAKVYPPSSYNGWKCEYNTCGSDRHWETVWTVRELIKPYYNI